MSIQSIQTDLVTLGFLLLGFIVLIYGLSLIATLISKSSKRDREIEEDDPIVKLPHKRKTDEIIDTLEWMKALGIIDTQEYNKLMVKCLPHLK